MKYLDSPIINSIINYDSIVYINNLNTLLHNFNPSIKPLQNDELFYNTVQILPYDSSLKNLLFMKYRKNNIILDKKMYSSTLPKEKIKL